MSRWVLFIRLWCLCCGCPGSGSTKTRVSAIWYVFLAAGCARKSLPHANWRLLVTLPTPDICGTALQTKWTVSATVFGVLVWQHNEYAAWAVIGAVVSSFICKVRPAAPCDGPGTTVHAHWSSPAASSRIWASNTLVLSIPQHAAVQRGVCMESVCTSLLTR